MTFRSQFSVPSRLRLFPGMICGAAVASSLALSGFTAPDQGPPAPAVQGSPVLSIIGTVLPQDGPAADTGGEQLWNDDDTAATEPAPAVPAQVLPAQPAPLDTTAATTLAGRAAQPAGAYKPSASTTGVVAGTRLTKYNTSGADLVISKDNTVLENLEIYGDIKIRAKNVTIRNSLLRGGTKAPGNPTAVVDATGSQVVNLRIEDSTIRPDRPHYNRDGIKGHDLTARRNLITGTTDGMGIFNRPGGSPAANVTAEANYIHSLTYFDYSSAHSDGTHNDGIQVQGGSNIRIAGNTIVANAVVGSGSRPGKYAPSAGLGIMLQQNVSKLSNVVVERNWVDNGTSSINIDNGKYSNITVTVRENLLGRNQYKFNGNSTYPIRIINRANSTVSGLNTNKWENTGALLSQTVPTGIKYNR